MKKLSVVLTEHLFMRRLWEGWRSGIEAAVVPDSGGIVFLGDSITHTGRWDLLFPTLATRNFGISGERAEHLLERLDPIVALRPEKLFLLIGTNDLAAGYRVEDIAAAVARILDRLRTALPRCELHLQAVMPRAAKFAVRIRALNRRYAAIAAERGIPFIDLFPLFDDGTGQLRKALTGDGLHLLGPGYTVWREALRPWVLPCGD